MAIIISDHFMIDSLVCVKALHRKAHDGDQALIYFKNGFGASVVKHSLSYGGPQGFYELAVIKESEGGSFDIVYDTPITSDVIGWMTKEKVVETLQKISLL